ncbi:sec-independent protein translocase protein TatB [Modicisalibacter ilicicola DSM 19980]|uniref:Sec-independent protein translocase protein TatB n=1 Tax=Modicisalibacter ilicicola DSM 19980 TaxID=1121942 RepID=A0A1M4V3M8_9GAMM|nr:Sec-independent protein translocase protein TatB [Halomonas ilicicola]SHE63503.1 sec-independent protein translocase protein TatB [Halomonas ilicicola DSM 19980]
MFDIGFLELLIIGVVALLVLGPERLPKAARTAGLWIGKIKRTVSGMQREINAQLEAEELRQKLEEHQKSINSGLDRTRKNVESYIESSGAEADPQKTPQARDDTSPPAQADRQPNAEAASSASAEAAEHEPVTPSTSVSGTPSADDKDATPR